MVGYRSGTEHIDFEVIRCTLEVKGQENLIFRFSPILHYVNRYQEGCFIIIYRYLGDITWVRKCAKFHFRQISYIYCELLIRFGQNKYQMKGYNIYKLFVIVLESTGAFMTSQFTINMQTSRSSKFAINRELLVRFGSNKNKRKSYSIQRLFVIVSGSIGAFVTSQVTICKFHFCKNLPYLVNYWSDLDQIKINGKLVAPIGSLLLLQGQ